MLRTGDGHSKIDVDAGYVACRTESVSVVVVVEALAAGTDVVVDAVDSDSDSVSASDGDDVGSNVGLYTPVCKVNATLCTFKSG